MKPLKTFKFKHVSFDIKIKIKAYDIASAFNKLTSIGLMPNHFKLIK